MAIAIACLPPVVALLALLIWPRTSQGASVLTVFVALVIVMFFPVFQLSSARIALGIGEGGATALPILAILFPALFFYQAQKATGAITVLQRGVAKLLPRREVQILLLVFGVGPTIEAMCGFGVGAIVILPLLSALEVDTSKVVRLSLFSQIISPWGALSVGTSLAASVSGVSVNLLSTQSALLLTPISLCFAFLALFTDGGKTALEKHWYLALVVAGLQISGLLLATRFLDVALAGMVAGLLVITFLVVVSRPPWRTIWRALAMHQKQTRLASPLLKALTPYVLLIGSLVLTRVPAGVSERLQTRGIIVFDPIHLHFALLSSPGVCLFFAAIVPFALFSFQAGTFRTVAVTTCRQFLPGFAAILGFLVAAALMQESGMAASLGSAAAMFGANYAWVVTLVGSVSGWLTGSVLSGNALAVPLQMQASARVGLPLTWIIAGQNISTALACIVSPARLVLIVTAAHAPGQEGSVLRKVAPIILWSIALTTMLLEWFLAQTIFSLIALLFLMNGPFVLLLWSRRAGAISGSAATHAVQPDPLPLVSQSTGKQTISRFWVQIGVYGGLLVSYLLYGSYSPVTAPILRHLDPLIFYCFSLLPLVPIALWMVLRYKALLDRMIVLRGGLLGVCLGMSFLCLTVALKDTNINETTVFSCVNGVTAALVACFIFKQRLGLATWTACFFALSGAGLVAMTSALHWQGDFVAFLGGSLLVGNSFLIEHLLIREMRRRSQILWPVLGIQLLVMAGLATLFAIGSGDWHGVTQLNVVDLALISYIALPGTLLPMLLLTVLQRYVSAVTVSFFAIIDPLLSAGLAFLAGERLPVLGYIGFGLVLLSVFFQALIGARETPGEEKAEKGSAILVQEETQTGGGQENGAIQLTTEPLLLPSQRDFLGAHSRTILAHLATAPQGMKLRDLQRTTHLAPAQLQHLLDALQRRGYVAITAQRQYTVPSEQTALWRA